jgi:hypothetical protein
LLLLVVVVVVLYKIEVQKLTVQRVDFFLFAPTVLSLELETVCEGEREVETCCDIYIEEEGQNV